MKIALVHDWILRLGGAERVLKVLHEMFPKAPIYTLFYDETFVNEFLPKAEIRTTFLQKIKKLVSHKKLGLLAPVAIESFNLKEFDVVISSSIAFSKGLLIKPKTKHICYCFSPTRWLWDWSNEYKPTNNPINIYRHFLRLWDKATSNRVDNFIAISKNIQKRIKKYYGKDSVLIYPPLINGGSAQLDDNQNPTRLPVGACPPIGRRGQDNYFLIVSRLHSHKNIDIAINAFAKLNFPLIIIGTGPEFKNLKKKIKNNKKIKMLGFIPEEEIPMWHKNSLAFIMPQEEDFGLSAIEAMSYGKPVLALKKGGALETVIEGINGEFFDLPHPAILADGVRKIKENIENNKYNSETIKKSVEKFSKQRFINEFTNFIHNNSSI